MKVTNQFGVKGLSGKMDESVFYYHPRIGQSFMRKYVKPDNAANTNRTKIIMANLQLILPSNLYKADFKRYANDYRNLKEGKDNPIASWYNLYIKMLFAMQKSLPEVNLETLNRVQIYDQNLPCKSVCAAIEAGLFPPVENYQGYNQEI